MSVEKFNKFYEQAAAEAVHDLPIIFTQWEQGQNPDQAKVLKSIEQTLELDKNMDPVVREMLEARAESMRPKLAWDKAVIARMVASVKAYPATLPQEKADEVLQKILKGSVGGSGKGRKAGSTTVKVAGASDKLRVHSEVSDFDHTYKSTSESSKGTIAQKLNAHLQEIKFPYQYTNKALALIIGQVIMGEKESPFSIADPTGTKVVTFEALHNAQPENGNTPEPEPVATEQVALPPAS